MDKFDASQRHFLEELGIDERSPSLFADDLSIFQKFTFYAFFEFAIYVFCNPEFNKQNLIVKIIFCGESITSVKQDITVYESIN